MTDAEISDSTDVRTTGWIYKLSKIELQEYLNKLKITFDEQQTVDELRQILVKYCKKKQNINASQPKMSHAHITHLNLQPFDGTKWECFEQQLECYIALNDVPQEKKVPLLLTKITPQVFEILTSLCNTKKPSSLSYVELTTILKNKYVPKKSIVLERATFRSRNQLPNEKIEDYVTELRKLASKCQFKDSEDQLKEKFIDGVHSKLIKFELLKADTSQTLEDYITLARTVEAALKETGQKAEVEAYVYYQQTNRNKSFQGRPTRGKPSMNKATRCFCCGGHNHLRSECTLRQKYCSECGQQGHIFKVCPKKKSFKINCIEKEETEDISENQKMDEYRMYYVNVSKVPPHMLSLNVEGCMVEFQLDTGSEVTVIPLKQKQMLLPDKDIKKCNVLFKNFDQKISQPLGIIDNLTVTLNNVTKQLNSFVTENTPCIIGRDWLQELGLWPPQFVMSNEANVVNKNVNNVSEARAAIKERFAEVFSEGWGNFKGETISLKLKKDAKPKSLPVRRVPFALQDKSNTT
ncbi:uncharacterized protein LOC134667408 [Cydia fagiglandana]|uniref:uncharacterized protein LOC134667408 n=1 Tax=Cydia fagiglandana TaxID=1458189 RepID=UPI002FEE31BD